MTTKTKELPKSRPPHTAEARLHRRRPTWIGGCVCLCVSARYAAMTHRLVAILGMFAIFFGARSSVTLRVRLDSRVCLHYFFRQCIFFRWEPLFIAHSVSLRPNFSVVVQFFGARECDFFVYFYLRRNVMTKRN